MKSFKMIVLIPLLLFVINGCNLKKEASGYGIDTKSLTETTLKDSVENNGKHIAEEKTDNPAEGKTRKIEIMLGDTPIGLNVKIKKSEIPVLYINLHENETVSYIAGELIFKKYGGTLAKIESKGNRDLSFKLNGSEYIFDPNRIFTENGRRKTLANLSSFNQTAGLIVAGFSAAIIDSLKIRKGTIVIALHNNTAGSYSVNSYKPGGKEAQNCASIYINPEMSEDDFCITTSKAVFDSLKTRKRNVVMQDNSNPVDDGSLSVYCAKENIDYVNIEAKSDHLNEQRKMVEEVYNLFRKIHNKN